MVLIRNMYLYTLMNELIEGACKRDRSFSSERWGVLRRIASLHHTSQKSKSIYGMALSFWKYSITLLPLANHRWTFMAPRLFLPLNKFPSKKQNPSHTSFFTEMNHKRMYLLQSWNSGYLEIVLHTLLLMANHRWTLNICGTLSFPPPQ